MRKSIHSFYEATLDPETFSMLADKLIALCGQWVKWDSDASETDIDMLRDAVSSSTLETERRSYFDLKYKDTPLFGELEEQDDRLEYEPENFWGIYRRIADQFLSTFNLVDLRSLPFNDGLNVSQFAEEVWTSYFKREVWHIICFDHRFAKLVLKAVSHPETYLETMNEIDTILIKRYGILAA